jgi:hypothetical protein
VKAAAAEEAKKIAEKDAEDKIRKAEEEARAAEDRAKQAGNAAEVAEAKQARERVNKLRATAGAKPAAPAGAPPPAAPPPATPQPQSGRKIRTEL